MNRYPYFVYLLVAVLMLPTMLCSQGTDQQLPESIGKRAARQIEQLIDGGFIVDFSNRTQFPKGSKVSAGDLVAIVHKHGTGARAIEVRGAHVVGDVILVGAKLGAYLHFNECHFGGDINFGAASMERGVTFTRCTIGKLSLEAVRSQGSIGLRACSLEVVNAAQLDVASHFFLDQCTFRRSEYVISLEDMSVGGSFEMMGCRSPNTISLRDSSFGSYVKIVDCKFEANFTCAASIIKRSLSIKATKFLGSASFFGINVAEDFNAAGAQFLGKKSLLNFSKLKVVGDTSFESAVFTSAADLDGLECGGDIILSGCHFHGACALRAANIGGNLLSDDARIDGEAAFTQTSCGGHFSFNRCQIAEHDSILDCSQMSIGGACSITDTICRRGINLAQAQIDHDLNVNGIWLAGRSSFLGLELINVKGNISLSQSRFSSTVNLFKANVGGILLLFRSQFGVGMRANQPIASKVMALNCSMATIGSDLLMTEATVQGPATFVSASIQGGVVAQSIAIYGLDAEISFRNVKVNGRFDLTNAYISTGIDCSFIEIGDSLVLDGVNAVNPDRRLLFNNSKIGRVTANAGLLDGNSLMAGGLSLEGATVRSDLLFEGTTFGCGDQEVIALSFADVRLESGRIEIQDCNIIGGVDWRRIRVPNLLFVSRCKMRGKMFSAHRADIGDNMSIVGCTAVFDGFDFRGINVGGSVIFRGSRFVSYDSFDVSGSKIAGIVEILGSQYECHADFGDVEAVSFITGSVTSDPKELRNASIFMHGMSIAGSKFLGAVTLRDTTMYPGRADKDKVYAFSGNRVNIDGVLDVAQCCFKAPVILDWGSVGAVKLGNTEISGNLLKGVAAMSAIGLSAKNGIDFRLCALQGQLDLSQAKSEANVTMNGLSLNGPCVINTSMTKVSGALSFEGVDFTGQTLVLDDAEIGILKVPSMHSVERLDLSMKSLVARQLVVGGVDTSQATNTAELEIGFLAVAKLDPSMYKYAAQRLLQNGKRDAATSVALACKRRERSDFFSFAGLWERLLDLTSLYGTSPLPLFYLSAILVGIGYVVFGGWPFRIRMVDLQANANSSIHCPPYNAFWYSVYLFLPFDNIQMVERWSPDPQLGPWKYRLIMNYKYLHQLLGWAVLTISVGGLIARFGASIFG